MLPVDHGGYGAARQLADRSAREPHETVPAWHMLVKDVRTPRSWWTRSSSSQSRWPQLHTRRRQPQMPERPSSRALGLPTATRPLDVLVPQPYTAGSAGSARVSSPNRVARVRDQRPRVTDDRIPR
jgi:hypothetical protein